MCLYLLNGIDVLLCGLEAHGIGRSETNEDERDEVRVSRVADSLLQHLLLHLALCQLGLFASSAEIFLLGPFDFLMVSEFFCSGIGIV